MWIKGEKQYNSKLKPHIIHTNIYLAIHTIVAIKNLSIELGKERRNCDRVDFYSTSYVTIIVY